MLHSTLWPAAEAFAQLPYDIIQTIDATITAPMPAELSKMGRHFLIQRRLKVLGDSLGYEGLIEVSTDEIVKKAPGRLDVVWNHPVADRSIAMEIDSAWRKRSMHKLARKSTSQLCLWIYYGATPVVTDDAGYDLSGVNIMQLDPRVLGIPLRVSLAERRSLEAYRLESKVAKTPRVLIDKSVLAIARRARSNQHTPREEANYTRAFMTKDKDGLYFFDYVSWQSVIEVTGGNDRSYGKYLERIGRLVRVGLKHKEWSVREKYLWLHAQYVASIEGFAAMSSGHAYRLANPEQCALIEALPRFKREAAAARRMISAAKAE